MILSDKSIRSNNLITPCEERGVFRGMSYGLSVCSYDVRVNLESCMPDDLENIENQRTVMTPDGEGILLEARQSLLVALQGEFDMPDNIVGFVKDKSTWSRRGLQVSQAVIDPGYKGYITLRITNVGEYELSIIHGEPIAQIVFQWLDTRPTKPYNGKYQHSPRGPIYE